MKHVALNYWIPHGPHWPICAPPSWGSAKQRHTAAQRGFIHEDAARHPQRPHSATQRPNVVSSTRMWQGTHSARTAPHSAQTWFHCPTSARIWQGTPSGLLGGGAGIFPHWGILKNNRKESIHETRWTSPRRRASGWIPERRHGGYAGGAVGIAGRAGGCRYRGIGGHCPEWHQRVGAGISGLCDTRSNAWAATIGTTRGTIAWDA